MAYSITQAAEQLKSYVRWQKIPTKLDDTEYEQMIIRAIQTLYVDTSRAATYNTSLISEDPSTQDVVLTQDLLLDEQLYVMLTARILFFQMVATDVNNIVGYTTDALSITNADKPYANIKQTLDDLYRERRKVYYKMVRYAFL